MNNLRSTYILPMLGLIFGLALIILSGPVQDLFSKYFNKIIPKQSSPSGKSLGSLVKVDGRVYLKKRGDFEFKKLPVGSKNKQAIFGLDSFQIAKHARLIVRLNSGYELSFHQKTKVVFELWDPTDPNSPAYVNFIYGNFNVIQNGKIGQLYIIRDDHFYVPQYPPKRKAIAFHIDARKSNQTIESLLADNTNLIKSAKETNPDLKTLAPIKAGSHLPSGTLSTSYIDRVIAGQTRHLRICRLTAMKGGNTFRGKMLVGFTLAPSGKVTNIKIFKTNIDNNKFQRCIKTVFQRMSFKAFRGKPILRTVPLRFGLAKVK